MKRNYPAIIFRQRDSSPIQVAFTAPSSEIDSWARVPTKRTGNIRHFQRAEISRHIKEITEFFGDGANSSPTAVVVGFDPIRAKGRVRVLDEHDKPIAEDGVRGGGWVRGAIEIEWNDPKDANDCASQIDAIVAAMPAIREFVKEELSDITGVDEKKAAILEAYFRVKQRTALGPEAEATDPEADSEPLGGSYDSEDTAATASLDEGALPADAPEEVRNAMSGLSPSERQVISGRLAFLASLHKDVLADAPPNAVKEIYDLTCDELKPGILIDGQHRVRGTRRIGNIPFLVTALPSADWPELAFQFIVTNRTARRVPESLLISIIGNSLSKAQREQIEIRLRDAGIRVGLIEAVMQVHEHEQSPFRSLLAFGLKNEKGFLDAAAMRNKVIQPWYERQGPVETLFDHFCQGKRKTDRTEFWKSEDLWFEFFQAFWSAVKTRYAGSSVFSSELDKERTPVSRLMTATVLMIFQGTILKNLADFYRENESKQGRPISAEIPDSAAFAKVVANTLQKLTPEFFTEWGLSGFDGSKGARDDLAEAIMLVIIGRFSVAQLKNKKNPHRLFKEQSKAK